MTETKISLSELITQLKQEKKEATRELSTIVCDYETKIKALEEIQTLKNKGAQLTREQYKQIAKLVCSRYWISDSKIIDPKETICHNCGPGAIEDCLTFGNHKYSPVVL